MYGGWYSNLQNFAFHFPRIPRIDKPAVCRYTIKVPCGYGGIGRRARFRFWCLRRAGSSPVTRTTTYDPRAVITTKTGFPIWKSCLCHFIGL